MRSNVGQWMTWGCLTGAPTETLAHAMARLEERGIHHLVVVAQDELRGVLTAEGALLSLWRNPGGREALQGRTVAEVMTSAPLPTASPETPLREAAQRMLSYGATALPVEDEQGELVGIITMRDLLSALVAGAAARHPEL